jgi:hypothetical protein
MNRNEAVEFDQLGKTVGLLLRLTKTKTIRGTAKVVVLDSSFCVLQGVDQPRGCVGHQVVASTWLCLHLCCHRGECDGRVSVLWRM